MIRHLVDSLDLAHIHAPGAAHVQLQTFVIDGISLPTVFQHPPSCVVWPAFRPTEQTRLEFHLGIKPSVWDRITSPVRFTVRVQTSDDSNEVLFERVLDPRKHAEHRAWQTASLFLGAFANTDIRLSFETHGEPEPVGYGWLGWGDPRLMDLAATPAVTAPPASSKPDIYLITCDALRYDHLTCYGAPAGRTPHIDALAADGVLVRHARSQTDTTLGSYASLLTGLLPHETKLVAEWGKFPSHLPSLPPLLAGAGYQTLLAVSEDELADERVGISGLFAGNVPCLGNPAQVSSVTMRRLLHRLEAEPAAQPRFVWVQLFEPHPPVMPEAEFAQRHIERDPATPHRADLVRRIHGIETSLDLEWSQAELKQGRLSASLLVRIEDTVRCLRGDLAKGPDFASHLVALGKPAWRGMERERFVRWLEEEVITARANERRASKALIEWLADVQKLMRVSEDDLISWLRDVQDFNYPRALYAAAVASVDAQVGALVAHLQRTGRYDNALIIFTAPHGECLDEEPCVFEHHSLGELVLRVPLIIKPPASAAWKTGAEIPGPVQLRDLTATIADIIRLPFAAGRSVLAELTGAQPSPSQPMPALSMTGLAASLYEAPFKLVRHHMSGVIWPWHLSSKTTLLFRVDPTWDEASDLTAAHPDVVQRMSAELERLMPASECLAPPLEPQRLHLRHSAPDSESQRTNSERQSHYASAALRHAESENRKLQKDVRQLTHILEHLRNGITSLYQSRRWKFINLFRKGRTGYQPIDRWITRFVSWTKHTTSTTASRLPPDHSYPAWVSAHRTDSAPLIEAMSNVTAPPKFGIILHEPSAPTLASIHAQHYKSWQLFDSSSVALSDHETITHWATIDTHDIIEPTALLEIALQLSREPGLDLLFTDEDEINEQGELSHPFFKPGWSPDTLESLNCVGALAVYRTGFLRSLNITPHPDDAYALALRAAEVPTIRTARLPSMLYHRRASSIDEQLQRDRLALESALHRRGEITQVRTQRDTRSFSVERPVFIRERVTIFIPTRDRLELLRRCIETLTALTSYDNYEIVIINNDTTDAATLSWMKQCGHRVFDYPGPFNYSAMHNAAVKATDSPWLLFLNNDTEITHPQWLSRMAEHVQRPEIAAVGAKLLYPDGTIQHAGVVLGIQDRAAHAFANRKPEDISARGQLQLTRNYSAVTAACMMMRREVFERLGGFDEQRFAVAYNDVELCVRALRHGYRNVCTPHAVLTHHECASRPRRDHPDEVAHLKATCLVEGDWTDPYYHPALSHRAADFTRA